MTYDRVKKSSWTPPAKTTSSFFPQTHIQTKKETKPSWEVTGVHTSKEAMERIRRSMFGSVEPLVEAPKETAPQETQQVQNPTPVSEEVVTGEIQAQPETGLSQSLGNGVSSQETREGIQGRMFAQQEQTPVQKQEEGTSPLTPLLQGEGSHEKAGGEAKGLAETEISLPIQGKLTIGEPNDKYEQEADRVARQVVDKIHSPTPETVQRQEMGDEDEVRLKSDAGSGGKGEAGVGVTGVRKSPIAGVRVNRKVNSKGETQEASADLEASIQGKRGSGQPLDESVREPMEQEFGADFSGVRVHTDGKSDELNQAIQAKAFTTGEDIFFREGAYEPGSKGGQELLAHELTHVVQQSGETVQKETEDQRHEQSQKVLPLTAENSEYARTVQLRKNKQSNPTLTNLIQRAIHGTAGNDFESYILGYLVPFMAANGLGVAPAHGAPSAAIVGIPTWQPALDAARGLDHRHNRLPQQVNMHTGAVTPASLLNPVAGGAAVPGIGGGGVHLQEMDLIRAFLVAVTANVGAGAGVNALGAQNSVINWGGLRHGFGTKVEAILLPGGEPQGSQPSILASVAWNMITHRKKANGNTLYAQGHLLHDDMGGPGLDYNLVPLTDDTNGDYGANNANLAHRQEVEGPVLAAYRDMHGIGNGGRNITRVHYGVAGDFNRPARPQTAYVQSIANAYLAERNRLKGLPAVAGGTGGTEPTHAQILLGLPAQVGMLNPAAVPFINDAMDALRLVFAPGATINGTSAILVHNGLNLNATLWQTEDQQVPNALILQYFWIENGAQTQIRNRAVSIDLPNSIRSPIA